jgi:hypothetical protein
MIQCLREQLLYSEKRMRDILFRGARVAVNTRFRDGSTVSLSRLTREMEFFGRVMGEREGIEANADWETAAKAVVNTMVRAGVLLGRRRLPVLAGNGAPVTDLAEDFESRCEAFLVEFLMCRLGDAAASGSAKAKAAVC